MKIFLDDRREVDEKNNYCCPTNYDECIVMIDIFKNDIEWISLDYDLSATCKNTGYDVLVYMFENKIFPKHINIHSSHDTGADKMRDYANKNFPAVKITANKVSQQSEYLAKVKVASSNLVFRSKNF